MLKVADTAGAMGAGTYDGDVVEHDEEGSVAGAGSDNEGELCAADKEVSRYRAG